nr:hypothetical protein CFP56_68601 [Quercus suber]
MRGISKSAPKSGHPSPLVVTPIIKQSTTKALSNSERWQSNNRAKYRLLFHSLKLKQQESTSLPFPSVSLRFLQKGFVVDHIAKENRRILQDPHCCSACASFKFSWSTDQMKLLMVAVL